LPRTCRANPAILDTKPTLAKSRFFHFSA
jgi:hypothetical protein